MSANAGPMIRITDPTSPYRYARSNALVTRVGFARECYSRRYIRIAGRWRDHVRYAMLAEDWRERKRARRRAKR